MSSPRQSAATILSQQPGAGGFRLPGSARRVPRTLDEALRTGPFHVALRYAIADSGLNLDGLRRRLAAEGAVVSLSALSYWQRGLRRPERPESVRAVLAIERIVGVRRSSLVALLGPPRPRGRWSGRTGALQLEDALGPGLDLAAVRDLDTEASSRLRHFSVQYDRQLGAGRTWIADRVRRAVTALANDADRFIAFSRPAGSQPRPPTIQPVSGCRVGRIRTDPRTGLHAAELLFDLPLRSGQTHVFEYEHIAGGGGEPIASWATCIRHPVRELILRAHFAPQALPACCHHIRSERHGAPFRELAELPLAGRTVNLVTLDVPPGIEGIRWEWE